MRSNKIILESLRGTTCDVGEIIGRVPIIIIVDMRCPSVIKIGFNDCGYVPGILIRGHTMFEIIKIRFIILELFQ